MPKNDEIAGMLAMKCHKLRRVDLWEENRGRVIVLAPDSNDRKDSKTGSRV